MNFKVIKSDILFRGKVFDLQVDKIKYNSENDSVREVAIHRGGSVVVALKDDGKIIMVEQYRYPLQKVLLELPAGKLEKNEDPKICAIRELEEETGYKAAEIFKLGTIATTPGFCTEMLHIYLTKNLSEGKPNREEGEYGMNIFEYRLEEIENKISNGEIFDAKTICGIYMAKTFID